MKSHEIWRKMCERSVKDTSGVTLCDYVTKQSSNNSILRMACRPNHSRLVYYARPVLREVGGGGGRSFLTDSFRGGSGRNYLLLCCPRILVSELLALVLQIVKGTVEVNLFRPVWFTWKGKDGYGDDGGYLQIKIFYCLSTKKHRKNGKSTGKTQRKHGEFGINSSVATLIYLVGGVGGLLT